ncbi:MAG: family 16 glycoside hydrolase [Bryobacteraceae bacterium]
MNRRRALLTLAGSALPAIAVNGWTSIFDGKTLNGWKANRPASWRVDAGAIVADGSASHLFYDGPGAAGIENFELEADVLTRPFANSGIYFHTAYQGSGFPKQGFEVQVNNTALGEGSYRERKRTGSLYGIRNVYKQLARDNEWLTLNVRVSANNIQVRVNGLLTVDYIEPTPPLIPPSQETARFLQKGGFALQCHDPGSHVRFRNLRYRLLPSAPRIPFNADATDKRIIALAAKNYPLVDYHVHFHESLGLPEAMEKSRRGGIYYGLAGNCGRLSRLRSDTEALAFLDSISGQSAFAGMQVEGEDWTRHFTRATCARFDYLFNDAMIWTGAGGLWRRIYRADDLGAIADPQAFVEDFTARIVRTIATQPIDYYANPTYLPPVLEPRRAELWTEARTARIIDAAARHGVALELSDRHRLPGEAFVKRAKAAGCKFVLGTGNGTDSDLRRCEYSLDLIERCSLSWQDFAILGNHGERAVDRRAHLFPA